MSEKIGAEDAKKRSFNDQMEFQKKSIQHLLTRLDVVVLIQHHLKPFLPAIFQKRKYKPLTELFLHRLLKLQSQQNHCNKTTDPVFLRKTRSAQNLLNQKLNAQNFLPDILMNQELIDEL